MKGRQAAILAAFIIVGFAIGAGLALVLDQPKPSAPTAIAQVTRPPAPTGPPAWTPTPTPSPQPTVTLQPTVVHIPTPLGPTATPPGEEITDPNYVQGKAEYVAKQYRQVLHLMSKVLIAHPDLAPPHWYRGMADYYTGNYQAGLSEMEQALAIDPNYALAYANRGLLYYMQGQETQALSDYQTALKLDPTLAKTHLNLAVLYGVRGDSDQAILEDARALAADPNRSVAWSNLSLHQLDLKQYEACVESASRAIVLQPDLWDAYFNRAGCETMLNQNDRAIADLDVYIKALPTDPTGWYNRGIVHRHQRQPQQAVADYTQAIKLDPTFTWAYFSRENVYSDLGRGDLATAALHAQQAPKGPQDFIQRGDSYFKAGNYDEALQSYQTALSLEPDNVRALTQLAQSQLGNKQLTAAIEAASQALVLPLDASTKAEMWRVRGRAHYWLGHYDLALADFNAVIAAQPSVLDYYYRGIAYQDNGQPQAAIHDLDYFVQHEAPLTAKTELEDAQASLADLRQ